MNFIKALCDEFDLDSDFINEQLPKIRNEAIKKSSVKKRDSEKSLKKALFAIIACHRALNKRDDVEEKQAELIRLAPLHFEQVRQVEEHKSLEVLPVCSSQCDCTFKSTEVTIFFKYIQPITQATNINVFGLFFM